MRKIFEVLRLSVADGRSHREIARAIIASPTTVGEILRRAKLVGLSYPRKRRSEAVWRIV